MARRFCPPDCSRQYPRLQWRKAPTATERVFDLSQLEKVSVGDTLVFDHRRVTNGAEMLTEIEDGTVTIEITAKDDTTAAMLTRAAAGESHTYDPFPGKGGNPVLLYFLETLHKQVAQNTGGSPFYIKNRIIDSFQRGTEVTEETTSFQGEDINASRIVFRPFELEKQKARLKSFADLELSFLLSDEVPGKFISLGAYAAGGAEDGFAETLVLVEAPEGEE